MKAKEKTALSSKTKTIRVNAHNGNNCIIYFRQMWKMYLNDSPLGLVSLLEEGLGRSATAEERADGHS